MSKKYILINGKKHYIKTEPTKVVKEEEEEEVTDEEKSVEKIAESIAQKIANLTKVKEADIEKKEKVIENKEVKLIDRDEKILKTRLGKDISLKHSEIDGLTSWFKAFFRDDKSAAMEYFQKHEPLNETTAAEGGYLVPTLLYNVIVKWQEDEAVIKPRARIIDMSGMKTNQLNISGIASKPRVSWTSEKSAKSTSSMEFKQQALTPYKLAAIVTITDELIEDSPFNIVQLVSAELADAITKEEDRVFAVGTGAAQPTGIDAYAWASTDCGGAMNLDHIQTAYFRLGQSYRSKGYWLMNSRAIEHIANLKDTTNRPLLLEEGIVTEPGFPALKRRPVLEQNDIGSDKIFFIDLSKYWIGIKHPMKIEMAKEATVAGENLWERNLKAIRIEERVDAENVDIRAGYELTNTGIS